MGVVSEVEPQVDIWGAERRTDLFEKVFQTGVKVRWAQGTDSPSDATVIDPPAPKKPRGKPKKLRESGPQQDEG
jgi:hypothetical protein